MYGIEVEGKGRLPIFPAILHQLEQRRNALKDERANYPQGTPEYEMYDSMQKAAKVILLACYGVLGMSSSRWKILKAIPEDMILRVGSGINLEDAEMDYRVPNEPLERFVGMVTYIARNALVGSKDFFDADTEAEILYGDTDSDFVKPVDLIDPDKNYKTITSEDMAKLYQFGVDYAKKLSQFFSDKFEAGIDMKLEKIFDRAVFGKAKKQYYCRTIWDEDGGWQTDADGKLTWYEYTKGLPLVRTDRTAFLKRTQRTTLQTMLDDPKMLERYWAKETKAFFANRYDHELILRIGIKKPLDEYKSITPVVRAARKLVERGENVRIGEKVAFLVVDIKNKKKIAEPIDETLDPIEAVKQYPPVTKKALEYYWKNRIWKNIKPFLELVLTDRDIQEIELQKTQMKSVKSWFKAKS
jgi:DNA polymerase elongation subunit (family B)